MPSLSVMFVFMYLVTDIFCNIRARRAKMCVWGGHKAIWASKLFCIKTNILIPFFFLWKKHPSPLAKTTHVIWNTEQQRETEEGADLHPPWWPAERSQLSGNQAKSSMRLAGAPGLTASLYAFSGAAAGKCIGIDAEQALWNWICHRKLQLSPQCHYRRPTLILQYLMPCVAIWLFRFAPNRGYKF